MNQEAARSPSVGWLIGLGVLGLIVLVDLTIEHQPHFARDSISIDTLPAFAGVFGLACGVLLVVAAKVLAVALKRKDTFYADD